MRILLHMMVKNEEARIVRALQSVLGRVHYYSIHDTGSTDHTLDIVESMFKSVQIPGQITTGKFKDWAQARNEGLEACSSFGHKYDYILLMDADMILLPGAFPSDLTRQCYLMTQQVGNLRYQNPRLLKRGSRAKYVGVTHEVLACDDVGSLNSPIFFDYADGSNRPNKFERDLKLLDEAILKEKDWLLHSRYLFYRGRTLQDMGRLAHAANAYQKRVKEGIPGEESWCARYYKAKCLFDLKDKRAPEAFWEAYNNDPRRSEPLYWLAVWYREKGMHELATACCELGLSIKMPVNALFVESFIYRCGFYQELALSGKKSVLTYRQDGAYKSAIALSTCPAVDKQVWLNELSTNPTQLKDWGAEFKSLMLAQVPEHFRSSTPSIASHDNKLWCILRLVNWEYKKEGDQFIPRDGSGIARTLNTFCELGDAYEIKDYRYIHADYQPKEVSIRGQEDCRLFRYKDEWNAICTVHDHPDSEVPQVGILGIEDGSFSLNRGLETKIAQKNWMPIPLNNLTFIHRCAPQTTVVDWNDGHCVIEETRPIPDDFTLWRGSSQLVPTKEAGLDNEGRIVWRTEYLAIIHEVAFVPNRIYLHRFVTFDSSFSIIRWTAPFVFKHVGVEFCCGLARHNNKLVASFSVNECESWLAILDEARIQWL